MADTYTFPFGQPVRNVVQTDCKPKDVFVLGVYSSAVHARWVGPDHQTIVNALAVASEPYIFWRGDNAEQIIRQVLIPSEFGALVPASRQLNGPSGITLDELILKPLGFERANAWLCDLVPHSCMNPSQKAAIDRAYKDNAQQYNLPKPNVPPVPSKLSDETRRKEILGELLESRASILILLGDKPIEWFLRYYDDRWERLSDFGRGKEEYGKLHESKIDGKAFSVLPLAHPRQIARLGQSSADWYDLHQYWLKNASMIR